MSRIFVLSSTFAALCSSSALAAPAALTIPISSTAGTVDGVATAGEWDDALSFDIRLSPSAVTSVRVKANATTLYVSFDASVQTSSYPIAEVLIDSDADHGHSWTPADVAYHVGEQHCVSQGGYHEQYVCAEADGWQAMPLLGTVEPPATVIELAIPRPANGAGFCAQITNGNRVRSIINPLTGYTDYQDPATWVPLQFTTTSVTETPSSTGLLVHDGRIEGLPAHATAVRLLDVHGRLLAMLHTDADGSAHIPSGLPSGLALISVDGAQPVHRTALLP
ncbi:MAG: hypothetical protein MUC47_08560 [Candidatus Kapabacteria bacterium]|nr:hypothetical protein [Candidatus Kapabacteria bacterium]